jgi:hypothetical protein
MWTRRRRNSEVLRAVVGRDAAETPRPVGQPGGEVLRSQDVDRAPSMQVLVRPALRPARRQEPHPLGSSRSIPPLREHLLPQR